MILKILYFIFFSLNVFASDLYYYNNHKKVFLTPQESNQTSVYNKSVANPHAIKYFKTNSSIILGIGDEILIKTKKIEIILQKYNLVLKKKLPLDIYLVSVKNSSETLDTANKLYEDSDILYAHPNFIRQVYSR